MDIISNLEGYFDSYSESFHIILINFKVELFGKAHPGEVLRRKDYNFENKNTNYPPGKLYARRWAQKCLGGTNQELVHPRIAPQVVQHL
jgi:hypothetical protein